MTAISFSVRYGMLLPSWYCCGSLPAAMAAPAASCASATDGSRALVGRVADGDDDCARCVTALGTVDVDVADEDDSIGGVSGTYRTPLCTAAPSASSYSDATVLVSSSSTPLSSLEDMSIS